MLEDDQLMQDEWQQQYYGFSSSQFSQDYHDMVHYFTCKHIDHFYRMICDESPGNSYEDLKMQIRELKKNCFRNLTISFAKVREIFRIPASVVTKSVEYSDTDIAKLEAEIETLKAEYLQEKLFLQECQMELKRFDRIRPFYDEINNVLRQLQRKFSQENETEHFNHLVRKHQDYRNKFISSEQIDVLTMKMAFNKASDQQ